MLYDKSWQVLFGDSSKPTAAKPASAQDAANNRLETAVAALKHYIISNRLRPGDPLPSEAKLCDELGVSRTAVREALRGLEALDIVVTRKGSGTFVSNLSLRPLVENLMLRAAVSETDERATLREVIQVRAALDFGNAERLCAALAGREDRILRELVEKMVRKAKAGKTFMDEDIAFHNRLNSYLENNLMMQLSGAMWIVHMAIVPQLQNVSKEGLICSAHAHGAMLEALVGGDIQAYRKAVEAHYSPLSERL